MHVRRLAAVLAVPASLVFFALHGSAPAADEKPVDFKKDIQPIFKAACIKCHQAPQAGQGGQGGRPRGPSAGFRLDDRAAALKGGKAGNDIVPGKADESLMVKLLSGPVTVGDKEIAAMPKGGRNEKAKPLTPEQIALIKRWVNEGAKWE